MGKIGLATFHTDYDEEVQAVQTRVSQYKCIEDVSGESQREREREREKERERERGRQTRIETDFVGPIIHVRSQHRGRKPRFARDICMNKKVFKKRNKIHNQHL